MEIIIKADCNDGDYVYSFRNIDEEDVKILHIIANVIRNLTTGKREPFHNWNTSEYKRESELTPYQMYVLSGLLTESQFDFFAELAPYGEFGIHTINSIKLIETKAILYGN